MSIASLQHRASSTTLLTTTIPSTSSSTKPPNLVSNSLWDLLPREVKEDILLQTDHLTHYLAGYIDDQRLSSNPKLGAEIWRIAFEVDWKGDLSTLPKEYLPNIRDGLLSVHTRSMYDRLCQVFQHKINLPNPDEIKTPFPLKIDIANPYELDVDGLVSSELIHIPLRHLWIDLIPKVIEAKIEDYANCLAMAGHLEFLRHAIQKGLFNPRSSTLTLCAALSGRLDLVDYLSQQGCALSTSTAVGAARMGHLHIVEYVESSVNGGYGFLSDSNHIYNAAVEGGHLDIVKYCHTKSFTYTNDTLYKASKNGHLEVVQFLLANNSHDKWLTWISFHRPLVAAADNGHIQVADYLYNNFSRSGATFAIIKAGTRGYVDFVKHFVEHYPMEANGNLIQNILAQSRRWSPSEPPPSSEDKLLPVIEYLHDAEWNKRMFGKVDVFWFFVTLETELRFSIDIGYLSIVKFIVEVRGCKVKDDKLVDLARQKGYLDIAEYLCSKMIVEEPS
jgi:hypothetical protein